MVVNVDKIKSIEDFTNQIYNTYYKSHDTIVTLKSHCFKSLDSKDSNVFCFSVELGCPEKYPINELSDIPRNFISWFRETYDTEIELCDGPFLGIDGQDEYHVDAHVFFTIRMLSGPVLDRLYKIALDEEERRKSRLAKEKQKKRELKEKKEAQEREMLAKLVKKYGVPNIDGKE